MGGLTKEHGRPGSLVCDGERSFWRAWRKCRWRRCGASRRIYDNLAIAITTRPWLGVIRVAFGSLGGCGVRALRLRRGPELARHLLCHEDVRVLTPKI